jgi:hypothetical protein
MARYFFALTNGDSISDDVGEEFDLSWKKLEVTR